MPSQSPRVRCPCTDRGYTLIEMLLVLAIASTVLAISIPVTGDALDEARTGMAAKYVEGRIMDARLHAIKRSVRIALRFEPAGSDYRFAEFLDGNGNGIRTADISAGIDSLIAPSRALGDHFAGVVFGLRANVPDVDGVRSTADADGVRFGPGRLLSVSPDGTSSSGTLYVRGRRGQYAIRVLGATGRTRVLRFDPGARQWTAR